MYIFKGKTIMGSWKVERRYKVVPKKIGCKKKKKA